MDQIAIFTLKVLRKIFRKRDQSEFSWLTDEYCQYKNQEANDAINQKLCEYHGGGFMLSKWGTFELSQAVNTYLLKKGLSFNEMLKIIRGKLSIPIAQQNEGLYSNAGVFPKTIDIAERFGEQALNDCKEIDVLGSYIDNESILSSYLQNSLCVNLDAFYAPWLFNNPWTKWLKGKNVVVVHPFIESIKYQYENNRERLFLNPEVLPQFATIQYLKAVQTQAGEKCQFEDWFDALHYMESEINKLEYDVAIIGCGAYGMSLAAHVKRQGKVALHLAGWTQMLFGVYGERWVSQQSQYGNVVNEHWIRPHQAECLKNSKQIEGGCYW